MKRLVFLLGLTACDSQSIEGDGGFVPPDATFLDSAKGDATHPDIAQPPPAPYTTQVATGFCTRMQNCCGKYDGGTFDYNTCLAQTKASGFMGTNAGYTTAVEQRMHVDIDPKASQACIAGLAVLSCPSAGSAEIDTLYDQCTKALVGKQTNGSDCIAAVECASRFCDSDGGVCALAPEAGAPLANDAGCTNAFQCASLICADSTQYACDGGPCTCADSIDFRGSICGLPPPAPPMDASADAPDAD